MNGPRTHHKFGHALSARADAERHYRTDAALDPQPEFVQQVAMLCLDGECFVEAARLFESLVQIEPLLVSGYLGLGYALVVSGRPAEALTEFQKAACLDPGNAAVNFGAELAVRALAGMHIDYRQAVTYLIASLPVAGVS